MKEQMMGWRWHQLDHMQIICTSLQTDNHASTSPLSFYGRMLFLPPNQQHQSTESKFVICNTHISDFDVLLSLLDFLCF